MSKEEKKAEFKYFTVPEPIDFYGVQLSAFALSEHLVDCSPVFNMSRSALRAGARVVQAIGDAGSGGVAKVMTGDHALLVESFENPGKFPSLKMTNDSGETFWMPFGRKLLALLDPIADEATDEPPAPEESAEPAPCEAT